MAWVSAKVYAILSKSDEGKDIIEQLPDLSQDECDDLVDEFFSNGGKGASSSADYLKAKEDDEFEAQALRDMDKEDDYNPDDYDEEQDKIFTDEELNEELGDAEYVYAGLSKERASEVMQERLGVSKERADEFIEKNFDEHYWDDDKEDEPSNQFKQLQEDFYDYQINKLKNVDFDKVDEIKSKYEDIINDKEQFGKFKDDLTNELDMDEETLSQLFNSYYGINYDKTNKKKS